MASEQELPHRLSRNGDLLQTYEIAFQSRFAILQERGNHLLKVGLQLIKGFALAISPRKPGT
jgi:hypothetical protein